MGLDEYDVGKAAGRGKFSTVYRAKRRADKTTVALKKINVGTFPFYLSSLISHLSSLIIIIIIITSSFFCSLLSI